MRSIPYRPELDGLRAIAVLLVLQSHTGTGLGGAGTAGVTLFFVLSGYLITSILAKEIATTGRVDLRAFYARRARRLLPGLAALLVAVAAFSIATNRPLGPVILTATYVGNLGRAAGLNMDLLGHGWSLALEEQFYLVWPVLLPAIIGRRRIAGTVLALALASASWRAVMWGASLGDFERVMFGPDTRADAILVGCALALVSRRTVVVPSWLGISAAGVWLLAILVDDFSIALIGPSALACAVVIAWSGTRSTLRTALSWRPLVAIGKISYGLYLWHYPVARILDLANPVAQTAAVLAVSFALAGASWFLIERPFLSKRHTPATQLGIGQPFPVLAPQPHPAMRRSPGRARDKSNHERSSTP